jgi:RND superfamily putative drug exporter
MLLAGKSNWWLPAWLDRRLPHLNVEGSTEGSSTPSSGVHPRDTPVTEG